MIDVISLEQRVGAALADPLYEVGQGKAPKRAGWTGGTAGEGEYVPYLVTLFGGAVPWGAQPVDSYAVDWRVTYNVRLYASSYGQWAALATAYRSLLERWIPDTTAEVGRPTTQETGETSRTIGSYKVVGFQWLNLGPVVRSDARQEASHSSTDSVALLLGRG